MAALDAGAVSIDTERCRAASRDEAWLSPVLSRRMPDLVADAVSAPTDLAGFRRAVGLARRHRVPVTPRGTGNHGQAGPLHGGMVLDLSRRTALAGSASGA